MYKIFTGLSMVFMILSIITFLLFDVKDNKKFDKELNSAVKELVSQVLTVQYKTHNVELLEEIFTEELFEYMKEDAHYYLYRNESFYFIGSNYMQTLRYNEKAKQWFVTLRVREGLLSGESFYLEIGFVQQKDGAYLVSFIGRGR